MNGKLLEVKDSVVTTNGYNYSLPETSDERTYTAQLMAREISESGNDDILASSWSDPVAINVYRAENILPKILRKQKETSKYHEYSSSSQNSRKVAHVIVSSF